MNRSKCQTCFNFNCSWHMDFKPVDGWTATPSIIKDTGNDRQIDSYTVLDCPHYKSRGKNPKNELDRVTIDDIAKDVGVHRNSVRYYIEVHGCKPIENFYKQKGYGFVRKLINERTQYFLIKM